MVPKSLPTAFPISLPEASELTGRFSDGFKSFLGAEEVTFDTLVFAIESPLPVENVGVVEGAGEEPGNGTGLGRCACELAGATIDSSGGFFN